MSPIGAVLLDLGDTLIRLGPFPGDLEERLAQALGAAGLPGDERVPGRALGALQRAVAAAAESPSALEVSVARTVAEALDAADPAAWSIGRLVEQIVGEADVGRFADGHLTPPVLRRLRARGLRLVVVSNTLTPPGMIAGHPEAVKPLAELDAMVFSVAIGVRKPGAEIYRQALALAGVGPEEALFVGDRYREDVAGPMALGIRAVLTHQFRNEAPGPGPQPIAVIDDLAEIEGIISQLAAD